MNPRVAASTNGGRAQAWRFLEPFKGFGTAIRLALVRGTWNDTAILVPEYELDITDADSDPALHDSYSIFGLRLISWLVGTRSHHAHPVVHRELLLRGIQIGIVAAGTGDGRSCVVGHHQSQYATEKFQRMDMRLNPGFQLLIARCFRIGVGAGSQHGNKP